MSLLRFTSTAAILVVLSSGPALSAAICLQESSTLAQLRGRFVYPDGSPAAGIPIEIRGFESNQDLVAKFGRPLTWEDPTAETAPDGSFSVLLDPPIAFQFTLDFHAPGFVPVSWRWSSLPHAKVIDIGEVSLTRGGTIQGHLVTSTGEALPDAYRVMAETSYAVAGPGGEFTRVTSTTAPGDGSFRLADVPAGPVSLVAVSLRNGLYARGPEIEVRVGETAEVQFIHEPLDTSHQIAVLGGALGFGPAPESIRLVTPKGDVLECPSSQVFEGLPDGLYSVEIDDPRFRPRSIHDVRPGDEVYLDLEGSASIRLTLCSVEGISIEAYRFSLRYPKAGFWPNTHLIRQPSEPIPAEDVYLGIVPGDVSILVSAVGYADAELNATIEPGQQLDVSLTMSVGATLTGEVRFSPTGPPAPGAEVALVLADLLEAARDPDQGWTVEERLSVEARRARCDDQGRFRFESLPPGRWALHAHVNQLLWAEREDLEISPNLEELHTTIVLPDSGEMTLQFIVPKGANFEELGDTRIVAQQANDDNRRFSRFDSIYQTHFGWEVDNVPAPDGRSRFDHLPAGELLLRMELLGPRIPSSLQGSISVSHQQIDLGPVTIEAGQAATREMALVDQWPGRIDVTARFKGAPAVGLVVQTLRVASDGEAEYSRLRGSSGQLDADGRLSLRPMLPGDWDVSVSVLGSYWAAVQRVTVIEGQAIALGFELDPIEATVTFVDERTGEPLANRGILVGSRRGKQPLQTDGDGKLRLTGVPGTMYFECADPNHEEYALDWTSSGPVTLIVPLDVD